MSNVARCLIPRCDGVILYREWKDAVWDKFVMAAPRASRGAPLVQGPWRGHAVSAAVQRSQSSLAQMTRSALDRCVQRHGISRLPDEAGDKPKRSKFKRYPTGFFHIDIAEV